MYWIELIVAGIQVQRSLDVPTKRKAINKAKKLVKKQKFKGVWSVLYCAEGFSECVYHSWEELK